MRIIIIDCLRSSAREDLRSQLETVQTGDIISLLVPLAEVATAFALAGNLRDAIEEIKGPKLTWLVNGQAVPPPPRPGLLATI